MVIVSPSILSADFAALAADCRRVVQAGAQWLHIDVMDGDFVPNISLGVPVLAGLHKALPCFYDVHLMIRRPLQYVQAFRSAGADMITFHIEAEGDAEEIIRAIHAAGAKAALCIKPDTPAQAVLPYLPQLDMVLVMSVEPGFGGQSFMPLALDKLRILREAAEQAGRKDFWLEVDGGVNAQTGAQCVAAGANVLVAGSAVFGAPSPAQAVAQLKELSR